MEKILPLAPLDKIIRKSGSTRVSDTAKAELGKVLEQIGEKISKKAFKFSQHAGRKTVKATDIQFAYKDLFESE